MNRRDLFTAGVLLSGLPTLAANPPSMQPKNQDTEEVQYLCENMLTEVRTPYHSYRRGDEIWSMSHGIVVHRMTQTSDGSLTRIKLPGSLITIQVAFPGKLFELPHLARSEGQLTELAGDREEALSLQQIFVEARRDESYDTFAYLTPFKSYDQVEVKRYRRGSRLPFSIMYMRIDTKTNETLEHVVLRSL